jgi:hypothetical protein
MADTGMAEEVGENEELAGLAGGLTKLRVDAPVFVMPSLALAMDKDKANPFLATNATTNHTNNHRHSPAEDNNATNCNSNHDQSQQAALNLANSAANSVTTSEATSKNCSPEEESVADDWETNADDGEDDEDEEEEDGQSAAGLADLA